MQGSPCGSQCALKLFPRTDDGADLYLTKINPKDGSVREAKPCPLCARLIIQAGINNVILRVGDGDENYRVIPAKKLEWCVREEE